MLESVFILLAFQLVGEAMSRAFGLPLPGPVIGLTMLFVAFVIRPQLVDRIGSTARNLLAHLSLLFVPAGVGVVRHLDRLGENALALSLAILLSTALGIAVSAAVFTMVANWIGAQDD